MVNVAVENINSLETIFQSGFADGNNYIFKQTCIRYPFCCSVEISSPSKAKILTIVLKLNKGIKINSTLNRIKIVNEFSEFFLHFNRQSLLNSDILIFFIS